MYFVKNITNFILNIFFPPKCVFCGKILEPYSKDDRVDGHLAYCDECEDKLHFCRDYKCCQRCGKPSATFDPQGFCTYCEKKIGGSHTYHGVSVVFYESVVKDSILRYKLGGKKHYSKSYAYLMYNDIKHMFNNVKFDLVTSAPPTKDGRKRKVGFDHAKVLAQKIAKKLKIKYTPCLKKLSSAKHQRGLSYSERIENLSGNIKFLTHKNVKGKTVLFIDDVCTTGSTIRECAKVLLKNGAKAVYSATLATVVKENLDSSGQLIDDKLYNILPSENEEFSFSIID